MTVIVHPHARHNALRLPVLGVIVATLLAAGIALKIAESCADSSRYDEAAAATMRAEAVGIRRAAGTQPRAVRAQEELGDLLRMIAGRAGTSRAVLVDARQHVVATGMGSTPIGSALARSADRTRPRPRRPGHDARGRPRPRHAARRAALRLRRDAQPDDGAGRHRPCGHPLPHGGAHAGRHARRAPPPPLPRQPARPAPRLWATSSPVRRRTRAATSRPSRSSSCASTAG